MTNGGTIAAQVTSLRFGSSRDKIADDWFCIRREIIGWIIGTVDFGWYTTVEGGLSDL